MRSSDKPCAAYSYIHATPKATIAFATPVNGSTCLPPKNSVTALACLLRSQWQHLLASPAEVSDSTCLPPRRKSVTVLVCLAGTHWEHLLVSPELSDSTCLPPRNSVTALVCLLFGSQWHLVSLIVVLPVNFSRFFFFFFFWVHKHLEINAVPLLWMIYCW